MNCTYIFSAAAGHHLIAGSKSSTWNQAVQASNKTRASRLSITNKPLQMQDAFDECVEDADGILEDFHLFLASCLAANRSNLPKPSLP
jgi:hypothetical protein